LNDGAHAERLKVKAGAGRVSTPPAWTHAAGKVTGRCPSGASQGEVIVFLLAFPDVMVYLNGLFRQKP
jgi:hypothetical protein